VTELSEMSGEAVLDVLVEEKTHQRAASETRGVLAPPRFATIA
jgi:hypothetical protein